MMIMAKHSRIAIIKSRKNGGTLLLLAAAAMHVMGASVSAQETPDFEAIRSVDTDIAAIGYRLATANAPLCDRQEPGLGLLLHTPDQYARDVRGEALRHFRFAGLVRSEEHTSELQSLMHISYALFCLNKKNKHMTNTHNTNNII